MKTNTETTTEDRQCHIGVVSNGKYWYRTDVYACVLCGKEKTTKQRVYDEEKSGTHWHDDACSGHF